MIEGVACKVATHKFQGSKFKGFVSKELAEAWLKQEDYTINDDNTEKEKKEYDCILELGAFARSGGYAMEILQKVYKNILKEFEIPDSDTNEIMARANLYLDKNKKVRLICGDNDHTPPYENATNVENGF